MFFTSRKSLWGIFVPKSFVLEKVKLTVTVSNIEYLEYRGGNKKKNPVFSGTHGW